MGPTRSGAQRGVTLLKCRAITTETEAAVAKVWAGAVAAVICTLGASRAALAQDAGAPLEEIVVTAEKTAASIQDVGVTITAFSGDELRERRIDSVAGLAASVANVELYEPTGGGVPIVVIRGVGLQDFRINNTPTASFYVDEVYQPSVATTNQGLFDLERIEVLKGPQGGLYGRNTTGGAIQVMSAHPSFDDHDGYGTLGFGRYGQFEAESAANVPVSDQFALRIAGRGVWSDEGYTRNSVTGQNHGAQDRWSLRAGALWRPTDKAEIYVNVHGGEDQSETPLLRTVGVWAPGSTLAPGLADGVLINFGGIAPGLDALCTPLQAGRLDNGACATVSGETPQTLGLSGDSLTSVSSPLNQLDNRWHGATVVGTFDLGALTFTSVSGYDQLHYSRLIDWDALSQVYQDVFYHSEIEALTQEFRLAAHSGPVKWIAGINYSQDELQEDSSLLANVGLVPVAFGVTRADQRYRQKTRSWAVFGRADLSLTEHVSLIAEARFTHETKEFAGGSTLPEIPVQLFDIDAEKDFGDGSGRLALEFAPNANLLWYASVSRGFKSGGFFGGFATSADELDPYDPETVIAYEVGVKSDLAGGRFRANAAVFHYDYKDLQGFANTTTASGTQLSLLSNVGDATISGADLELAWAPFAGFVAQLNVGLLDGEITDSDRFIPDSLAVGQSRPLEGQRLTNQSDLSADLLVRQEFTVGTALRASFQVGYAYRSDFNFDFVLIPQERPLYREPAYGLANLRLGLGSASKSWEIAGWVENLFDEAYRVTAKSDDLGGYYELFGPPRTYGVALTMRW